MSTEGKVDTKAAAPAADATPAAPVAAAPVAPAVPAAADLKTVDIVFYSAANLIAADRNNKSDPYVVVTLNNKKARSKTIHDELNPDWKEEKGSLQLTAKVGLTDSFHVELWDYDRGMRDDFLGQFELKAWEVVLHGGKRTLELLDAKGHADKKRGTVDIGLTFPGVVSAADIKAAEDEKAKTAAPVAAAAAPVAAAAPAAADLKSVDIVFYSATNLIAADRNDKSDPYVVVTLNNKKARSKTIHDELNPDWKEEKGSLHLTAKVGLTDTFHVELWDYDRGMRDDFLGQFQLKAWEVVLHGGKRTLELLDAKGHVDKKRGTVDIGLTFPGVVSAADIKAAEDEKAKTAAPAVAAPVAAAAAPVAEAAAPVAEAAAPVAAAVAPVAEAAL